MSSPREGSDKVRRSTSDPVDVLEAVTLMDGTTRQRHRRKIHSAPPRSPSDEGYLSSGSKQLQSHGEGSRKAPTRQTPAHTELLAILKEQIHSLQRTIQRKDNLLEAHDEKFEDVLKKLGFLNPYDYDQTDSEAIAHMHGIWRSLYYDVHAWLGGPKRFDRKTISRSCCKDTEVTGSVPCAQCGTRGENTVGTRGPVRKKVPHWNSSAEQLCSSAEALSALELQN